MTLRVREEELSLPSGGTLISARRCRSTRGHPRLGNGVSLRKGIPKETLGTRGRYTTPLPVFEDEGREDQDGPFSSSLIPARPSASRRETRNLPREL